MPRLFRADARSSIDGAKSRHVYVANKVSHLLNVSISTTLVISFWNQAPLTNIGVINNMASAQVLRPGPIGQPDIGYAPDLDKYLARVARRKENEKLGEELPTGFPKQLQSDLVWGGSDITDKYNYIYQLNDAEIEEIEAALTHFNCLPNMLRSS